MSPTWMLRASWTTQATMGLAGLAASSAAALTLFPLISGGSWFSETFLIMALIVGSGLAMRRITQVDPVILLVQVAAATMLITALHAADTALLGILPGPGTWEAFVPLWQEGMEVCRRDTPPVTDSSGLLLVIHCGMAAVTLAVDSLVVCLRRPAAAGLPLLAVYCVPAAALPEGLPWYLFVLAGVAFLALIASDSRDRFLGWGRVLDAPRQRDSSRDSPRDDAPGAAQGDGASGAGSGVRRALADLPRRGLLAGAKRVGALSVLLALLLPGVVPGLDRQLIGPHRDGDRSNTIHYLDPFLDLKKNLSDRSEDVVIRFRTNAEVPAPLRVTTADRFDGKTFVPSEKEVSREQRVQEGLPAPPGLSGSVRAPRRTVRVSVSEALSQSYLPLPYPASRVEIAGDWLFDEETLNVFGDGQSAAGATYTVEYFQVTPSTQQLERSGRVDAQQFERYLAIPAEVPASIGQQADRVAGRAGPYSQASRLQEWFRSSGGFVYTTQAPAPEDGDAIAGFLNERHGYCAHFASAMALMARSLGIPSRVATGFLPGRRTGDTYEIQMTDAHAWPELFFEGIGWVRFEPTPSSRTGNPPGWTSPVQEPTEPAPAPTASASVTPTVPGPTESPEPSAEAPETPPAGVSRPWHGGIPWVSVLGPVVLAVLFLSPSACAALVRRRRLRRHGVGAGAAEGAWADLLDRLEDLGILTDSSWTPRTVREHLHETLEPDDDGRRALDRLVQDLEEARYLPRGAGRARAVSAMARDVRAVTSAVARTRPRAVRLRTRWLPLPRPARDTATELDTAGGLDAAGGLDPSHELGTAGGQGPAREEQGTG